MALFSYRRQLACIRILGSSMHLSWFISSISLGRNGACTVLVGTDGDFAALVAKAGFCISNFFLACASLNCAFDGFSVVAWVEASYSAKVKMTVAWWRKVGNDRVNPANEWYAKLVC